MDATIAYDGSGTFVIRDKSGTQVATATTTENVLTMTCNGGRPTIVTDACSNVGDNSACVEGTCTF